MGTKPPRNGEYNMFNVLAIFGVVFGSGLVGFVLLLIWIEKQGRISSTENTEYTDHLPR